MVDKRIVSAGCLLLVGAAAWLFSGSATTAKSDKENEHSQSRVRQGLEIAPVPLDLAGKNRGLAGMGSYLVNAAGSCADCHSCPTYTPGHNPYGPPSSPTPPASESPRAASPHRAPEPSPHYACTHGSDSALPAPR